MPVAQLGDRVAPSGYPFLIDEGEGEDKFENLYLEPQPQLIYSRIDLDDSNDIAADVRFKDVDSLIGRVGVRLTKDWFRENDKGETHAWGQVRLLNSAWSRSPCVIYNAMNKGGSGGRPSLGEKPFLEPDRKGLLT